jgi:hypothetical protein
MQEDESWKTKYKQGQRLVRRWAKYQDSTAYARSRAIRERHTLNEVTSQKIPRRRVDAVDVA